MIGALLWVAVSAGLVVFLLYTLYLQRRAVQRQDVAISGQAEAIERQKESMSLQAQAVANYARAVAMQEEALELQKEGMQIARSGSVATQEFLSIQRRILDLLERRAKE